jgi:transcriptional regulator with XRE-family HTH domain
MHRNSYIGPVSRIATLIPEARLDLGLSQSELSRLSGVSRSTIAKLEDGGRVEPELVLALAAVLFLLELSEPLPEPWEPADTFDDDLRSTVVAAVAPDGRWAA